jgi:hypothetical protein
MMSSSFLNMLLFNSNFIAAFGTVTISVLFYFLLLPVIQSLIIYEKKKWLQKHFSQLEHADLDAETLKKQLLEAAEPGHSYPIYKFLKFSFATAGILSFFVGLLILIWPEDFSSDTYDKFVFLPLLIGLAVYFICRTVYENHRLWREISALFLYLGSSATALMAYENFELIEWFRQDILSFGILALGIFLVYHLNSVIASYIYLVFLALASVVLSFGVDDSWLSFLPQMLWAFVGLILYFWLPKLKLIKDIGPRESVFGILFLVAVLSLSFFQLSGSSGLYIPIIAVVFPGVYLFSRAYFSKSSSLFGRSVEISSILLIVVLGFLMSVEELYSMAQESIALFENYSFAKQVSYLILSGLFICAFYLFSEEIELNEISINPKLLWFPLFVFLVVYIIPVSFGSYLIWFYLLWLGYDYVSFGLSSHSELNLYLGVLIVLGAFFFRFFDFFGEDMVGDGGDQTVLGISLMFWGVLYIGLVIYLRERWLVTGPLEEEDAIDAGAIH